MTKTKTKIYFYYYFLAVFHLLLDRTVKIIEKCGEQRDGKDWQKILSWELKSGCCQHLSPICQAIGANSFVFYNVVSLLVCAFAPICVITRSDKTESHGFFEAHAVIWAHNFLCAFSKFGSKVKHF